MNLNFKLNSISKKIHKSKSRGNLLVCYDIPKISLWTQTLIFTKPPHCFFPSLLLNPCLFVDGGSRFYHQKMVSTRTVRFFFSNKNSVTCRVFIDSVLIHLETDDADPSHYQGSHLLGVEFGDFRPDEDQLPVLALEFIPVIREWEVSPTSCSKSQIE